MSKRISLSDNDIELIGVALWQLHQSSIINPSFTEYALASRQRIEQITTKIGYNRKREERK